MESNQPQQKKWLTWLSLGCLGSFGISAVLVLAIALLAPSPTPEPKAEPTPEVVAPVVEPAPIQAIPMEASVPAPVPIEQEAPASKQKNSVTVYTTSTGEKYHRSGCSSLRKSRIPTTLDDAQSIGYEPCRRCKPPS